MKQIPIAMAIAGAIWLYAGHEPGAKWLLVAAVLLSLSAIAEKNEKEIK